MAGRLGSTMTFFTYAAISKLWRSGGRAQ